MIMAEKSYSEKIKKRAIKHGLLFIKRNQTIRTVAQQTGFAKGTVHLDLHRLEFIRPELFEKVKQKLEFHLQVRHIRGGEASRKRHKK